MCVFCFVATHGWEPDMGDGVTTFAPGTCTRCARSDLVVFTFIEES